MRKSWWLILLLMVLALSAVPVLAQGEEPPTDDAVNEVAGGMYCPVCENIPLDVCPTQACAQWRDLIREKLAQGWSEQQIRDYFVAQYGDRVLSEPPGHWLNWLTYTLVGLGSCAAAGQRVAQ
jgi:cytochrome c-type biogenesis protein CcmH